MPLIAGLLVLAVLGATGVVVWLASSGDHKQPSAAADRTAAGNTGLSGSESLLASPSAGASAAGGGAAGTRRNRTSPTPPVDPNLLAEDDFTGTAINTGRWSLYESTGDNGSTWSPSMDQVAGGELRIVGTGTDTTSGKGNTSGGLCWCGTGGSRTYGRWQLRARFDAGSGFAPVIGLWPDSGKPETDGWMTLAGIHTPARDSASVSLSWPGGSQEAKLAGNFTTWHTFTVEWRATFVRFWVDGRILYDSTTSSAKPVIPNKPMHLYIQQEVGPSDSVAAPNASTPAQVVMHIDWVKMYR